MIKIRKTRILCPKHGTNLWQPTVFGKDELPVCLFCEPHRYMDLMKRATKIEVNIER